MKKVLSLVLSLALIIATMALPISASAASIDLLDVGKGSVNLTYEPTYPGSADSVRPGEQFTVAVVANTVSTEGNVFPASATSFCTASVKLQYDANLFEYVSAVKSTDGAVVTKLSDGIIFYDNTTGDLPIEANKARLMTLTFNVKDVAYASMSKIMSVKGDKDSTGFTVLAAPVDYYDFVEGNLTETPLEVNVAANTAVAKIDGVEITNKTYYNKDGVMVSVADSTNLKSATITPAGGEPVDFTDAKTYAVTTAGTYTVDVAVKGEVNKSYTFTLSKAQVAAKLDLTVTDFKDSGYVYGDVITMPVMLSGLDGATASVVSFDVTYDSAKFDLAVEGTDATLKTVDEVTSVVYDSQTGLTVSGTDSVAVATLKLTVKSGIAYGDATVTIANPKMALAKSGIDPTADSIGLSTKSQKVTVIPTGEFVTYTNNKTDWSDDGTCNGEGYAQTVNVPANVEVKYAVVTKGMTTPNTGTQEDLASLYGTATELTSNAIKVNAEATYYVVAKVGSVYILADTLVNGTNVFYDGTAPNVNASAANMSAWAQNKTINKADITVTDELSQPATKIEYSLDGISFVELPEAGYTFDATFDGEVTIKGYDKAGNSNTDTITIKVDKTAPTADISEGTQSGGKKELVLTASDANSQVKSTKVYYDASETGAFTSEVTADTESKYYATQTGYYRIVVTDNVDLVSTKTIYVTIDKISATSDIQVTVVKNGTAVKNGFLDVRAMTTLGIKNRDDVVYDSNGKFTYVKIAVDAPKDATKYENQVYLGEELDADGVIEVEASGDYTVKVVTVNKVDASDKAESTYKFSIVAPADMPSVNADKRYNIIDYAYIKTIVGSTVDGVLPDANSGFWGGLFSGDVTGDLTMKADDLLQIITSLRAGEVPGAYYGLSIMNQTKTNE